MKGKWSELHLPSTESALSGLTGKLAPVVDGVARCVSEFGQRLSPLSLAWKPAKRKFRYLLKRATSAGTA
jgi:hypothetical protein